MCGRFVSSSPPDKIAAYFDVDSVPEQLLDRGPNFNTAPTTGVLVVYEDGSTRHLDAFHWGLVPSWAKDTKIGARMINARAETVASKPAFKRAFAGRRCIIPADGFYEWTTAAGREEEAAVLHPPSRRGALCVRRHLGAVEGPQGRRGGGHGGRAAPQLLDHHHHGQRADVEPCTTACR